MPLPISSSMWVISCPRRTATRFFKPRLREFGIEHPFSQHGVKAERCHVHPVARQHDEVIFQVVPDLGDAGIGQWSDAGRR